MTAVQDYPTDRQHLVFWAFIVMGAFGVCYGGFGC